ncbi:MAG: amino acid ABC transporter ATP-binding protein, partial [Alphaproteobacteria bacterium]|nr:amino acid ABC transporter ATP-binding protein [Alphaproteobacteria bacterium]
MSSTAPIVVVKDICKTFQIPGRPPVHALQHVTNHVDKGEVLVVIGPSGSGKSTFLRALNGLQPVDSGSIVIDGVELTSPKTDLNKLRQGVGMVFQNFNLFQHKTALENITMPQMVVLKRSRSEADEIGGALLERVGIADKADSYPSELSGGQQQRVAIARALAMTPKVMLFDEATSALDPET